MRNRAAFHFAHARAEALRNRGLRIRLGHKLVAGGNRPAHGARAGVDERPLKIVAHALAQREAQPVHRGHKALFVAQCAGIHVVLHGVGANHHVQHMKRPVQRAAHAGVDHHIGMIQKRHRLRAHGRVHLADSAYRQHHGLPRDGAA